MQVLTVPHREGRRGHLQVDGEEPVSGESPGSNVMANTEGSIYVGTVGLGTQGHMGGHRDIGGNMGETGWDTNGHRVDVGWMWNGHGMDTGWM